MFPDLVNGFPDYINQSDIQHTNLQLLFRTALPGSKLKIIQTTG